MERESRLEKNLKVRIERRGERHTHKGEKPRETER